MNPANGSEGRELAPCRRLSRERGGLDAAPQRVGGQLHGPTGLQADVSHP